MPSFAARCACFSPMGYGITPMSTIVEATPPLLSRLKFLASNLAKTHPRLFLTIARHRENHVRKLVDENTDVVMRGTCDAAITLPFTPSNMHSPVACELRTTFMPPLSSWSPHAWASRAYYSYDTLAMRSSLPLSTTHAG